MTTSTFNEGRALFIRFPTVSPAISPVPSANNLPRNRRAVVSPWPQWLSCKSELRCPGYVVVHGGSGTSAWETPKVPSRDGMSLEEKQRGLEHYGYCMDDRPLGSS